MIAFVCLLSIFLIIYVYRAFAQFGDGFSGGLRTEDSESSGFTTSPLAVPLALAAGWLLKGLWRNSLGFPFDVMCHEIGHSIVGWLGGRWSIPVIAGIAITDYTRSLFLTVLVAGGILWLSWKAIQARNPLMLFCSGLLIAGFVYMQFFVPDKQFEKFMLMGGHAGEFIFPALLIAAFYYRGPATWRWDWFRYPVMVAAAFSLVGAWEFWAKAVANPETGIYYGVNVADRSVADSDIARLIFSYGWTAQLAVDRFLLLGRSAWLFVVLFYAGFLLETRTKKSVSQDSK